MNEDSRIEGELRRVLDLRTFIDVTPDDLRHLSAWLRPKLPANKRGATARMARLLVLEAACGESAEVAKNGAVFQPLKAAKHLLALGFYEPDNLSAIVEDTRRSLAHFKKNGDQEVVSSHPADNRGLQKGIAAAAAGYGATKRELAGEQGNKRLDEIAAALWSQVKRLAAHPDLTSLLEQRNDTTLSALARYEQYKQTSAKNTGSQVPSNEDAARPRPRRTIVAVAVVVGVSLLIGIPVAVALLAPPSATAVDIYRPLSATIATSTDFKLEPGSLRCQFDSKASERFDVSSCFGESAGYDPCFATGRDGVFDCPSASAAGVRARYFEGEVVFSNLSLGPSFSEIVEDEDPWAIEVAIGPGQHWACFRQDLTAAWWDLGGSRWVCSNEVLVAGYRLVGDPENSGPPFEPGDGTSPPFSIESVDVPEGALIAGELDRDGEVWTVLVADANGSLGRKVVLRAWY